MRVPAAAWAEFLCGVAAPKRREVAANLLQGLVFQPFGQAEADVLADLQRELFAAGKPLPWHDGQLAATALVLGEALVSNDKAFGRVPGLERITY